MAARKATTTVEKTPPQELTVIAEPVTNPVEKKQLTHFGVLNVVDVGDYIEQKKTGNATLSYLSWANAWAELKKRFPDATYVIKRYGEAQLPYVYDPITGFMVFTEMTIEGITYEMWLPVMDGANKAMKSEPYEYSTRYGTKTVDAATMFDINKTIMRCLVKNVAMFGLGLYIYAGEDLPEGTPAEPEKPKELSPLEKEIENIHEEVLKQTKGMAAADKVTWAQENISPIASSVNYKVITDLEIAKKLLAHIKGLNNPKKKKENQEID